MLIAVSRREGFRGHRASVISRLDKFKEASIRQVWLHCAKSSIGGRGGRDGGKVVVVDIVVVVTTGYRKTVLRCNTRTRCQAVAAGSIRGSSRMASVFLAAKVVR
jgi:hypothetical protein